MQFYVLIIKYYKSNTLDKKKYFTQFTFLCLRVIVQIYKLIYYIAYTWIGFCMGNIRWNNTNTEQNINKLGPRYLFCVIFFV